ncbi:Succinate dehydrogenase cytochrome b-556 subunit [hydrothermal vent metagenome]|uniref:Succinate dehydrogenase cytochrome b-556 subunit n=1 Tax=hydrothermal vent metagenome TaxID=652676 RepID=A0A3B0YJQ9_9ZZZZ
MNQSKNRPVFLNLFLIRFPVTAILSILHRVTGVLMVLTLPVLFYLFSLSLSGEAGWDTTISILTYPLSKMVLAVFLWGLIHHLFAGIRFLFIDIEIGIEKATARVTAWFVNIVVVFVTLMVVWRLW